MRAASPRFFSLLPVLALNVSYMLPWLMIAKWPFGTLWNIQYSWMWKSAFAWWQGLAMCTDQLCDTHSADSHTYSVWVQGDQPISPWYPIASEAPFLTHFCQWVCATLARALACLLRGPTHPSLWPSFGIPFAQGSSKFFLYLCVPADHGDDLLWLTSTMTGPEKATLWTWPSWSLFSFM